MSSPLSAPFSVFPSKSHTCLHPRCTYRGTRSVDLDRHLATHHRSSMGHHSPITAPNVHPPTTTPAFPSPPPPPPESDDHYEIEPTAYPFPPTQPRPTLSTRSTEQSPQQSPSTPRQYKFPFGYHAPAKTPTSSTASSAASSSPSRSLRGRFRLRDVGGRKAVVATRRSADTVMRCGRHGDEWLGLSGWRFWR